MTLAVCKSSPRSVWRAAIVVGSVVGLTLVALAAEYPRTLTATASVKGAAGAIETTVTIHLEHLMTDADYEKVASGLKYGGYPKFLEALRRVPVVGSVEVGRQKADLKYARVRTTDKGELLVVGADRPIYFLGAGRPESKPKAGYETAFLQIEIDAKGNGEGTMAAAARVKPGDGGSVVIDDYADEPIRLLLRGGKTASGQP